MADMPGFNENVFKQNVWAGAVHDTFVALIREGFTDKQAMELMVAYIGSVNA